uniref:Dipeptidyl peptidase 3 n=1 Tax=Dracunculus medinensis TaxID=318479 RepID=A0A0N4U2V0_DRAME
LQTSYESAQLFVTFYRLFSCETISSLKEKALKLGWTENDFLSFLTFVACFYGNSGNYKSFGDSKIVPDIEKEKLRALLKVSAAAQNYSNFLKHYDMIEERVFSLNEKTVTIGLPDKGVSGFFSSNVNKEDTDIIADYFKKKRLEEWNTRLLKNIKDGETVYTIRLASIDHELSNEKFSGATILIERCDYGPILLHTVHWLKKALPFVANENQEKMISMFIKHFESGDINEHKEGSRYWIKDIEPVVEFYIGFIENYRDPVGTRASFEGFVAVVNKSTSKKFQKLVKKAEDILTRLPWEKEYEKDVFLKPDFTALDVISFASDIIPQGINIPNYDAIRQDEGFKNVTLSNVMAAIPAQKINFLTEEDEALFVKHYKDSFEVQVGLHELLGHGSGKLFQRNVDGTFNFDKNVKDMITGQKVTSWYEPGETWSSKFGDLSNPYEECRADGVGYYLSTYPDILKIFGFEGEMAEIIKYVNWMLELRSGLLALEFYSAETKKWRQAHCYGRFVLLNVCIEAGKGLVTIDEVKGDDGEPDLLFKLDKTKIDSVGKPAIGQFLRKLQAYKSTGDYGNGSKFFMNIGNVSNRALKWRDIVIKRRQPRKIFVQSNTLLDDNGFVSLKCYPASFEGVIQSFVDRYSSEEIEALEKVWLRDFPLFNH